MLDGGHSSVPHHPFIIKKNFFIKKAHSVASLFFDIEIVIIMKTHSSRNCTEDGLERLK
jgi:hypothetical protein